MALFGKPRGIDTGALQRILNQGALRQTDLINRGFSTAEPLLGQFEQKQTELGQQFETGATQRAQQFAQNLQNVESPDIVRDRTAKATELAFRNLPAAQQAIRENLAATGGLNRGAAIRALQQPVLQASRQAADQSFRIEQAAAGRDVQRREQALDTIFTTGQGAALTRLGIDRNTASVLLKIGRGDILDRAFRLAGIESGRTQGLLDIEQLRQQQNIARDAAKRQQLGNILTGVGSLAGAGIGLGAGGPLGGVIGSQLGGQFGRFAGGGGAPDLSGSLALLALRNRRSTPTPIDRPIF